jgi:zinc transport system substrate-binding protein
MNLKKALFLCIVFCIILAGCSEKKTEAELPVKLFTSILPQKYFVEKIGGDRVSVEVLVSPGKSPATYEPSPQQVIDLGSARALFTIGVPFEKAFLLSIKSNLTSLEIVDTSAGITKRMLGAHSHEDEEHEEHGEDEHEHEEESGTPDPHIWLSPKLVKQQAQHIYSALAEIDPAGKDFYKEGYDSFILELDEIDSKLKTILAPFKGETLFVFHPAFGYFADDYGLKQVAIETGGKEPAPSVLEEIIEHALEEGVKIIFVQAEFSQDSAQAIAEAIGGAVISLNPLNPDYINNLEIVANEMIKAF